GGEQRLQERPSAEAAAAGAGGSLVGGAEGARAAGAGDLLAAAAPRVPHLPPLFRVRGQAGPVGAAAVQLAEWPQADPHGVAQLPALRDPGGGRGAGAPPFVGRAKRRGAAGRAAAPGAAGAL
ncbi:unnamed protein product, partial [Effrenium voratum]